MSHPMEDELAETRAEALKKAALAQAPKFGELEIVNVTLDHATGGAKVSARLKVADGMGHEKSGFEKREIVFPPTTPPGTIRAAFHDWARERIGLYMIPSRTLDLVGERVRVDPTGDITSLEKRGT